MIISSARLLDELQTVVSDSLMVVMVLDTADEARNSGRPNASCNQPRLYQLSRLPRICRRPLSRVFRPRHLEPLYAVPPFQLLTDHALIIIHAAGISYVPGLPPEVIGPHGAKTGVSTKKTLANGALPPQNRYFRRLLFDKSLD